MRYIRLAATPRQHSPRPPRSTPRPRTQLRSPQVRLALLRLAIPPRTTQAVLQAHRDPLRLRTTRAVGLLTALLLRLTLVAQQGQAEAPLQVGRLPTGLVAAQVDQRLRAGLLLTALHVEHLAEQPKPLAGRLAGQLTGHLRPVSLRLEVTTPQAQPTGGTVRVAALVTILNGAAQLLPPRSFLVRHTQPVAGLTTEVPTYLVIHMVLITESTAKRVAAIHVEHLAEQVEAPPRPLAGLRTTTPHVERVSPQLLAGLRTTTPHVELLNQRQHRLTLRLRSALARLRVRLTRLRLEQVTVQRPRSTQRLRSVRHTEQATARLLRLIPTLRDLLVMQLAQADQRPQTATHQP